MGEDGRLLLAATRTITYVVEGSAQSVALRYTVQRETVTLTGVLLPWSTTVPVASDVEARVEAQSESEYGDLRCSVLVAPATTPQATGYGPATYAFVDCVVLPDE